MEIAHECPECGCEWVSGTDDEECPECGATTHGAGYQFLSIYVLLNQFNSWEDAFAFIEPMEKELEQLWRDAGITADRVGSGSDGGYRDIQWSVNDADAAFAAIKDYAFQRLPDGSRIQLDYTPDANMAMEGGLERTYIVGWQNPPADRRVKTSRKE